MEKAPCFNYIITIHNKEDLIEEVIKCVLRCCRDNSHIYPVLDGCTDRTEEIIDGIINKFADAPITKVYTPDVHEILSINAGLRAANQKGDGYNIILQDDVLLTDSMLEKKVAQLYEWAGSRLGFVSFRMAANFIRNAATSKETVPLTDFMENAYGHGLLKANVLLPGSLAYRSVPIKSPICIPFALVRTVGMLEERLAPYMCDDIEYAIRSIKAGYQNAVFALRFRSDAKWGSTRIKQDKKMGEFTKRNMGIIRELHGSDIAKICDSSQTTEIVEVPNMASEEDKVLALEAWNRTRQQVQAFTDVQRRFHIFDRIKSLVRGVFGKAISYIKNVNH
jgi:glycosyltransferase involved in cell wall biosynthesis